MHLITSERGVIVYSNARQASIVANGVIFALERINPGKHVQYESGNVRRNLGEVAEDNLKQLEEGRLVALTEAGSFQLGHVDNTMGYCFHLRLKERFYGFNNALKDYLKRYLDDEDRNNF